MIDRIDENLLLSLPKFREQEEYWQEKLAGTGTRTNLMPALANVVPAGTDGETSVLDILFPESLSRRMFQMGKGSGLSVYLLLLTAVKALIYRYNNPKAEELDITVLSPVYTPDVSDETLNHSLFIRNTVKGDLSFKQCLLEIRQTVLDAYDNQDFPMERVTGEQNNNLTGVMCGLENIHQWSDELRTQYSDKLIFLFRMDEESISGKLFFHSSHHQKEYIRQVPGHLTRFLSAALKDLDPGISAIPFLSEEEKKKLMVEFNNTASDYPGDKTIPQLFEEQVKKHPHRVALVFRSHHITYGQLNLEAEKLAEELRNRGVQPNTIVALKEERNPEMIYGIMAILKAGGAYLPLESDYPQERIDYMLKDSQAHLLLDHSRLSTIVQGEKPPLERGIIGAGSMPARSGGVCPNGDHIRTSTNLAYIIYTSGTTGKPKGVLTSHRNVVRVVKETNFIRFTASDRVLQLSNYAFDGSVFDIYGALLNGGALVIVDKECASDANELSALIIRESITSFFMTSTLFNTLVDLEPAFMRPLKTLMAGGERLSVNHCKKALEYNGPGWLVNGYGPTETTVFATYYPIDKIADNARGIPIGRPLANTTAYILDRHLQLLPVGVTGELYVGGDGLAHGYLNAPELTHARFVTSRWGERLYRTGDLAHWRPDGDIEFFGRIDRQVKIRGFRIELEEIENRIMEYEAVSGAVVIDKAGTMGERYLCAYVTVQEASGQEGDMAVLRGWLLETLPVFMVPAHIIRLDSFPLTANNKLDYRALPEPQLPKGSEPAAVPVTRIQRKLTELWSAVLLDGYAPGDIDNISMDADFFQMGGHSLKATLLVSRIRTEMGFQIPLKTIFMHPNIRALADYLETQHAASAVPLAIQPVEKREYYPLSAAQKRLFFISLLHPESTAYNIPLVVEIRGEPPVPGLNAVFTALIRRHESLRTSFQMMDDVPVQVIHDHFNFEIGPIGPIGPILSQSRPFDLSQSPQLRVSLHETGTGRYALVIETHHIVMDGMSLSVLVTDFKALYLERDLPPLAIQYKDFALWQNLRAEQERIKAQEQYWLKMFEGDIPVLELPYDFPRPEAGSFEGGRVEFHLDEPGTARLNQVAGQVDATLYVILLSLVNVFLARICGQQDIVVGMPVAGRKFEELNGLIGMFVNTLALRAEPAIDKTFNEFAGEVRSLLLESLDNQDYPLEELVDRLSGQLDRQSGRNPLFDVVLAMQNMDLPEVEDIGIPNLELKNYPGDMVDTSRFDLTITAREKDGRIHFNFAYNSRLFKAETIRRLIRYFTAITGNILADVNLPLGQYTLLDDSEKKLILEDFNRTDLDIPAGKTIHGLFEDQSTRTPHHAAVVSNRSHGSYRSYLTYSELGNRSNDLAQQLRDRGAGPGSIVAVRMKPTVEMIAAILAVLKTGAAYLPMDPDIPRKRMNAIIKDSAAGLMMDERGIMGSGAPSACLSAAYILYTSGSTGRPKGVVVSHDGVINLVFGLRERVYNRYAGSLNLALVAPFVFDASVKQIFVSLLSGYCLDLVPPDLRADGAGLLDYYSRYRIDVSDGTPIHLSLMTEAAGAMTGVRLPRLKHMLIGGEALPGKVVTDFFNLLGPSAPVIANVYGPTECTVDTTSFEICPEDMISQSISQGISQGIVPIGRPMPNVKCLVLSSGRQLAPVGVAGELYVGGAGVAFGYLNRPQLTSDNFIDSPFFGRMYKTGDRCRWKNDGGGNLEFLGRVDQQVKIRGFRVEPGEIENRLLRHEGVKAAVVVAWSPSSRGWDNRLCAYVVPAAANASDVTSGDLWQQLSSYLSSSLPAYMIPSLWMELGEIPVTGRGKLDRRRLPQPEISGSEDTAAQPSSTLEKALAAIWSDILKIESRHIGITSNFFNLGGHSMGITMLTNRVQRQFNVKIPLAKIFNNPTIAFLSAYIENSGKSTFQPLEAVEKREYYPVTSAQKRFYILHHLDVESVGYNTPLMTILEGKLDISRLEQALERMVSRHETLRTSFEMVANEPVQRIHETEGNAAGVSLLERYTLPSGNGGVDSVIDEFVRPFDLGRLPLMRLGLLPLEPGRYLLMWDKHHIITDARSSTLFLEELPALYRGEELAELSFQYKDYANWRTRFSGSGAYEAQQSFWSNEFTGHHPVLNLPMDYPRPASHSFEGRVVEFHFSPEETAALKALAAAEGVTLFMLLSTIMNVFLWTVSRQEDIVIGTTVMARGHADVHRMMGVFLNSLALRNFPTGNKIFKDFLGEVKARMLRAFENQDYPFETLVDQLNAARTSGRNPLFDVMFAYGWGESAGYGGGDSEIPIEEGLSLRPYFDYDRKISPFDLSIGCFDTPRGLYFSFGYSTNLFKLETVQRFVDYYKEITSAILKDITVKLKDIEISHDLIEPDVEEFQLNFGF